MTQKRFDYIDIAKGLGILMVVWAHILLTGWSHRFIYAFHMPLFFFLSGMLFQRQKYPSFMNFVAHRAKRLLLPYVIYSVVTWCMWAVFQYLRHGDVTSYVMPLLQTFIAQGSGAFIAHNSALWFIPCLFLVEILYFFISRLGDVGGGLLCFALACASFVLGYIFGNDYWLTPPWNADAALVALPFYAVGNVLVKRVSHSRMVESVNNNKWLTCLVWLGLTAALLWSALAFNECSMGSSSYQCGGLIFIPRAFLGIVWLIMFALLLSTIQEYNLLNKVVTKNLKWAGVKSLDIMCLHIPLKGICMIVVAVALHITVAAVENNALYSLCAFIMTMTGCRIAIHFIVQPISRINLNCNRK